MTDRELMQQALEALEGGDFAYPTKLATDLRERLAQPVQEPVTLNVDRLNQWLDASLKNRKPAREQPAQRKPPQFPTMLRKMWSGAEVQKWINEKWEQS